MPLSCAASLFYKQPSIIFSRTYIITKYYEFVCELCFEEITTPHLLRYIAIWRDAINNWTINKSRYKTTRVRDIHEVELCRRDKDITTE